MFSFFRSNSVYFLAGLLALGSVPSLAMASGQAAFSEMPASCNNERFLKAEGYNEHHYAQQRAPDLPVHVCGSVSRIFHARKTRSGRHFYFLLQIAPHKDIRIVLNLDELQGKHHPYINVGDKVEVQGRYYYDNPHQQGIDWTHHGASKNWTWPGFITVNGQHFD